MHISTFCLMKDLCIDIGLDSSDVQYLVRRLKNEGIKFLTSTLPKLWKCVSWSFQIGFFDRANPSFSLTCFAWKGRSLRFFRSLLDRIFDPKTGRILGQPDATAVFKLRMLCEYLYKLCLPFSEEQLKLAEGSYRSAEECYEPNKLSTEQLHLLEEMRWGLSRFYPEVTTASKDDILHGFRPRFGPGSMNLKSLSNYVDISVFSYWEYKNLPLRVTGLPAKYGGISGFFKPYPSAKLGRVPDVSVKRQCEVLFVPKNADGPRVISRENPFDIRLQMAYQDWAACTFSRVTNGHVQFSDQSVNKALAQIGSLDGSYGCADLKDASDRVSYRNAFRVFRDCPGVTWFFKNTRSTHYYMNGHISELKKLSNMGSGLTFPTMSMYIYLASIVGCIRVRYTGARHIKNIPGIDAIWREIASGIHVYGDDICFKSHLKEGVFFGLENTGLAINHKKTHYSGPFRESCGGDYVLGQDVTPVRLKLMNSNIEKCDALGHALRIADKSDMYLVERHCRELVKKGFVILSETYYKMLEKAFGRLPYVSGVSPYLGRYVSDCPVQPSQKAWIPIPRKETFELMDPYTYLGRNLRPNVSPLYEDSGLTQFGEIAVPHVVKLKKRLANCTDLIGIEQGSLEMASLKRFSRGEINVLNAHSTIPGLLAGEDRKSVV